MSELQCWIQKQLRVNDVILSFLDCITTCISHSVCCTRLHDLEVKEHKTQLDAGSKSIYFREIYNVDGTRSKGTNFIREKRLPSVRH